MAYIKAASKFLAWSIASAFFGITLLTSAVYIYLEPQIPDVQSLKNIELQTPLRIYSQDNKLIREFGEQKRVPLNFEQVPPAFVAALLAAEDSNFYQHNGVDLKGLMRATVQLIITGKKKSGGSTITMQVAKNYYLSSKKTFSRKFTEILLALKIEEELSKEEILEMYLNKIYLGKRAYGLGSAAQVYYNQSVEDLNLPQLAMLAGLPQAPSAANPINNPIRAKERRNHVLARMRTLSLITLEEFDRAASAPITAKYHGAKQEVEASYVAEMVRSQLISKYGKDIYGKGYNVYTTIKAPLQTAANTALQNGLLKYDREHGFRGVAKNFETEYYTINSTLDLTEFSLNPERDIDWPTTFKHWHKDLRKVSKRGLIEPAIVAWLEEQGGWAYTQQKQLVWLDIAAMQWAQEYISVNTVGKKPEKPSDVLTNGDLIWLAPSEEFGVQLAQQPEPEGALISIEPSTGKILSLVGGFDYNHNKYNHVEQAKRQPGSAFKPFIYSAALANGYTAATIVNDAPVVFEDAGLENTWRPQNHSGKFYGPTRLRKALYRSQNLVSIRVLKQLTPWKAIDYITPFGFDRKTLNKDLSLALGASAVTPLELATGYCALANGGYQVNPYIIDRIELGGKIIEQNLPDQLCDLACREQLASKQQIEKEQALEKELEQLDSAIEQDFTGDDIKETFAERQTARLAPQVMDERTHYLIYSMMKDVVKRGTGTKALALGRKDLAGKTGTTNDQKDAWFSGFNQDVVTTVWVGFDQPKTLGRWAFGGTVALPIWVDYMATALVDKPNRSFPQPDGLISVRIDPDTGKLASASQQNAIFEIFKAENAPQAEKGQFENSFDNEDNNEDNDEIPEQLF